MRRAVLLLALCAGCGGSSGPAADVLAELDALARGPNRAFALTSALVAPGTLLLTAMDDNLLTSINLRLGTETTQCAVRTQVPGTLTATFPASGCTLQTGQVTVSGTMTITIARDGATVRVLDMIDLTVEGEPMTGELVIITTDGNQFTYTTLAALSGHEFDLPMLSGQPINSVTDTTGMGTTTGPAMATRQLVYTGVSQRFTACHAQAGTIELVSPKEGIDRTLTYSDATPQTGVASFVEGGVTSSVTLPSVPSCPPPPAMP